MKIYMMGDSTMKYNNIYTYPQMGWGQVLHLFAKNDVLIIDHAENGRSTKSFIDEGRFDKMLNSLEKGDFVICSFGHNDEKINDSNRYTSPFGTYQENLKYFYDKVKEKDCHIVYTTPITRHKFIDGLCVNSHMEYPKAMMEFCTENNLTCIDLNNLTIDLYNKLGEEESKKFHMIFPANVYKNYSEGKDDHSHLVFNGAKMVCELFVSEIKKTLDPIKDCFLDLDFNFEIDYEMLKD